MNLAKCVTSVLLVFSAVVMPFSTPVQAAKREAITSFVTGAIASGGTFAGLLRITQFTVMNGVPTGVGTLTGAVTDAVGNVVGPVTDLPITIPVTSLQSSCTILTLTLGALDLNLRGLMVHFDRVVLNISGQQSPSNSFGNLLCGVAGLLDNSSAPDGLLQSVASVLNQILARL
jgi:hypothetical protein